MFEVKLKFERPSAVGWHSLVFPQINDLHHNLEVWVNDAFAWFDERGIRRHGLFWCMAHARTKIEFTVGKKVELREVEVLSPVFFFKDHWSAIQMKWRFSGEFTSEGS